MSQADLTPIAHSDPQMTRQANGQPRSDPRKGHLLAIAAKSAPGADLGRGIWHGGAV